MGKVKRPVSRFSFDTGGGRLLLAAGLFVLSVGLYLNTLGHGFVFDDMTLILQNPQVTQLRWGDLFFHAYRQVRTLTYALNYWLAGPDPFGFHLFNVLLHGINSILVFLLVSRLSRSVETGWAGALLFAVHPVQTSAVAYISGRKDLLAAFFVMCGLLAYLRYRNSQKRESRGWLGLTFLCFVLGVFSKEVVLVFPGLVFLIDVWLTEPGSGWFSGRRVRLWGAAGLVSVLLFLYFFFFMESSRMQGLWGGSLSAHIATTLRLFPHYLKLVIFPFPLIADYTGDVYPTSLGLLSPWTLGAVAVWIAFGLGVAVFFRRRLTGLGLAWFLLTLFPVLQIVPFHELAADHFLYLPMVGIAFVAGSAVSWAASRGSRPLAWGSLVILAGLLSVKTFARNGDWENEKTLWEATYRDAPGSYRANANLAVVYQAAGNWQKAVEFTRRSIALDPSRPLSYNNLGALLRERAHQLVLSGRVDEAELLVAEAIDNLKKATELNPTDPFARSNLADCYKELGLIWDSRGNQEKTLEARREAVRNYEEALRIGSELPEFALVKFKLGMVFVDHQLYQLALESLLQVVDKLRGFDGAQYWTGYCYFQLKDYRQAAVYLERALQLNPNLETFLLAGHCREQLGETGRALAIYETGLKQHPQSLELTYSLAVIHERMGNMVKAAEFAERALRMNPSPPLEKTLREILADQGPSEP